MKSFNLSEWALTHKSLVVYLMLVCSIAGAFSYLRLGREEDPPFTIKTMTVQMRWPGATASDMLLQVTDRIEKKLEETPFLDYIKSYTKPGEAVIYVYLKDTTPAGQIPDIWYQVRKKVSDIMYTLPQEVVGPFFNDEFGDVFGTVYAFTADGFSYRELRDYVEFARTEILRIPDVAKVNFIGLQDEIIYLNISSRQLAGLGIDISQVAESLREQNAVIPAGALNTGSERIALRVSGGFTSEDSLRAINLRANDRFYRLDDIATIERGYVDPPTPMFRYNGQPAIGLAVSMRTGGDVLALGEHLHEKMREIQGNLPVGIETHLVSDQPVVVEESIHGFVKTLEEAVLIVLGVSFLSLGLRAGTVVATSIPLVLAITFVAMEMMGLTLQRISLGALIIALGLLVDDAMITVEMMISKLEEGLDRFHAASFAYTSTAFPMLTGTLVTVVGFVPIGFAKSGAGEYCFSLFAVIGIALLASWFVAVLFAPLIGFWILPKTMKKHAGHEGEGSRLQRAFRAVLLVCMRLRYVTIVVTLAVFAASIFGLRFVQQEFFPASDRPELLVDLSLPKYASIWATQAEVEKLERLLANDPDVERYTVNVGSGVIRFYLPLDVQLANDFFAQALVVTKGYEVRNAVRARLERALAEDFPNVVPRISALELGPPVGWPIKFRVSGNDPQQTRDIAEQVAAAIRADPNAQSVNFDWNEMTKVVRLEVDQDRARQLGLSSQSLSAISNALLSGTNVTQVRDNIYLINVQARAEDAERLTLETLRNLQITLPSGRSVPLDHVATLTYGFEEPLIWRRGRLPTITVQADIVPGTTPVTAIAQLMPQIQEIRAQLPPGASITVGGTVEESAKGQASVMAPMPIMLFLMLTILMVQLQSFQRLFLVVSVAPLGVIGVVAVLVPTYTPLGFVAILGVIALVGMIIRNSVILIDQIETNIAAGQAAWDAVVNATVHRLRPIMLTAAAAILGMIPIMAEVFWGPMAYAVAGGLAVATLLTLLFLPALYVAWFRIREPQPVSAATGTLRPAPALGPDR